MDVDVNESTGHINISAKFQSCRETAIQGAVRRYDFYLIFSSDSLTTKIIVTVWSPKSKVESPKSSIENLAPGTEVRQGF